jgi:hypothetical protein
MSNASKKLLPSQMVLLHQRYMLKWSGMSFVANTKVAAGDNLERSLQAVELHTVSQCAISMDQQSLNAAAGIRLHLDGQPVPHKADQKPKVA